MDLRIGNVARLLGETDDTIYRWAREGTLPAHRVYEQYSFNSVELQEWATAHRRRLSPQMFLGNAGSDINDRATLRPALERGGIYHGVPGGQRDQVLAAVADLPGIPGQVNPALLEQLLITRESLASTGIGEGIAIPHPRDPVVVHTDEPIMLLCFLSQPVDFHAIDGQPVEVLFALLSPTVPKHLQMLSRLAFVLHDPALRELLRAKAQAAAILACIDTAEAKTAAPAGKP